jgi:hypothetical protein
VEGPFKDLQGVVSKDAIGKTDDERVRLTFETYLLGRLVQVDVFRKDVRVLAGPAPDKLPAPYQRGR